MIALVLTMLVTLFSSGVVSGQEKPTQGYAPLLLEHLKIPQTDLIGYSMGGAAAMQCAIRHPAKVLKVVVISSMF